MRSPTFLSLVALMSAACGSVSPHLPAGPSPVALPSASAPGAPTAADRVRPMSGMVRPASEYPAPCWADRYACEVFEFMTPREGPIEVMVTWDGPPRALRVQLFWAGEGLAHEDIAPPGGPARIAFVRPRMEAAAYRLRVVSLEPDRAIPFTLTIVY